MRRSSILLSTLAALAATSALSQVGDLCTGGEATGTGLRGAYYSADPRANGPVVVRVDARLGAQLLRTLPAPLASQPPHTARWCGWIRPIVSGPHRVGSDNPRVRIEIGKQPVAGQPIKMEAGRTYAILVELPDPAHAGEFNLRWTPPFGATYDVPPTVLFPPLATVEPGC